MTAFRCMCEPMKAAQFFGDETHAVATRPQWALEHGLSVVLCVDGYRERLRRTRPKP